mmetsp:Transcript_7459/g.11046  ORF Transcript_7459/g.11046 Transcript_7459/m.11046 type:complete len:216 (+) Transcript_7459:72-719(+)
MELVYFKGTFGFSSRGEQVRLCMALGKAQYKETPVTFGEWRERKQQTPFGCIPILKTKTIEIAQGPAIVEYVSKQFNIWPKDPIVGAQAQSILFFTELDHRHQLVRMKYDIKDEKERSEAYANFCKQKLTFYIERILATLGSKAYLFGDFPTGADMVVFNFLGRTYQHVMESKAYYGPEIATYLHRIATLPTIANFLQMPSDFNPEGHMELPPLK